MSGHGILSGPAILDALDRGEIEVDPLVEDNINPASLDLRLGHEVVLYDQWVCLDHNSIENVVPFDRVLDVKDEPKALTFKIDEKGIVLRPNVLYLMHTVERVTTDWYVPVLDGKSSLGRLGVQVHVTAGYGDPGFNGQYTLEVLVTHPVRVYAGMRFCQIRFHTLVGPMKSYQETGNYKGETARGAVPSAVYKQFLSDEGLPRR